MLRHLNLNFLKNSEDVSNIACPPIDQYSVFKTELLTEIKEDNTKCFKSIFPSNTVTLQNMPSDREEKKSKLTFIYLF